MWSRLGFVVLALCVSGCWNKEFNEPGRLEVERRPTEAVIPGAFSRVWAATQAVMAKFTIVQRDVDPNGQRAYMVTDWTRAKSDTLYHGYDVTRVPYTIRYRLYIYVLSDRGGTRVTIKSEEQYLDDAIKAGTDFNGSLHQWITTESSTLKENKLLQEIDKLQRDVNFKGDASQ